MRPKRSYQDIESKSAAAGVAGGRADGSAEAHGTPERRQISRKMTEMTRLTHNSLIQALWQASALVALACLIALGVNHWRSDGIPVVGDWSAEARFADAPGDSLVIALDQAAHLYEQETALFVDARPQGQFAQGHIRGALSLPWQEVDRYFVETADRLGGTKTIITYCDGESCELSHELALFLKDMGFEDVRVLVNGWSVWRQAGLPTDGEMTP
jgi:3-mercaptopyruvate sulfurtransferase SseA